MVSNGSTNTFVRRAGRVHDALHLPPLRRADRNDEAVVSQCDVVFAGIAATSVQDAFERFLNRGARLSMLARIRLNSGEASSLISPLGNTARRTTAARAKIGNRAARAERRGNFPAATADCRERSRAGNRAATQRCQPASLRRASSAAQGPTLAIRVPRAIAPGQQASRNPYRPLGLESDGFCNQCECGIERGAIVRNASASIARRPGAHVVWRRNNSRSVEFKNIFSGARHVFLSSS